ncbi:MAG: nuclease-related domain-containing protein [Solirubrobacteraceae bacterium]
MLINRKAPQAGAYAERRYRRGLRRYRSKTRPILTSVLGPFILAGLAVLILDGHHLSWYAGALTGICTGVWIAFRETPPPYVENWHDGAEGERKTEKALKPLGRSGWQLVHDVQARYGNYDHIAVGPAGVFLFETKNLQGIVELRDGVPHLRRRLDPEADTRLDRIRPRALAAAASLKEDIESRTGHRTWVQAIVVFWSEFPEGLVDDGRCIFVHGPRLHALMQGRPNRLNHADVEGIATAIACIANRELSENPVPVAQGLCRA